MPNHHIVDGGDPEKGHDTQYGYDQKGPTYEEPFVHGHATVAEAAGTGGDTHRGLKSRHIQFLYVQNPHLVHNMALTRLQGSRWCYWNWSVRRIRRHSRLGWPSALVHGISQHDDCRMECYE
jgi:hypothetical protein